MVKNKELIIFGAGEIAVMAKYYFENDSQYRVKCFIKDDEIQGPDYLEGLPVIKLSEARRLYPPGSIEVHVAISFKGLNSNREKKYNEFKNLGYKLASYISTRSSYWPDLDHGDNCFILENQTIQPTVKIGSNVMIWSGNHIGHRAQIGDHVYISSHVCIAGFCSIGQRSFLGVNSTIRDFIQIGSDCFIAMGALVTQNLGNGSLVLGPKCEVIGVESKKNKRILKLFFG